ncbi:MAG: hypothetical protein JEZ02_13950 [Desulfatibacillum sp.]|nr:hypothetical protein [Desulfatibacillum sp.]
MPPTPPSSGSSAINPPLALALALFFMAFGYSLLSVCLFRILSFVLNSTSFFMLYVCVGMPLGALFAKAKFRNPHIGVRRGIQALLFLTFFFPLIGWIIAQGPCPILEDINYQIRTENLWKQLAYMTLFTSPLFILWGSAEYSGYEAALAIPKIRKYFYLLFVWGLACALAVGAWTIPHWGWLRTLVLAGSSGMAALAFLYPNAAFSKTGIAAIVCVILAWVVTDYLEAPYMLRVLPGGLHRVGGALEGMHPLTGQPLSPSVKTRLLHQSWGKYCHVEMVEFRDQNDLQILGSYDGAFLWECRPDAKYEARLDDFAFRTVKAGSDICIIGSGGGKQVAVALETDPNTVTAVDIIPELFPLLKGDLSWVNGHVFKDKRVECVAGDGRHYLENSNRTFDLILLPHTESIAATRKSALEPGRFVHTVEAFMSMKNQLKPQGVLAVIKMVDRDNKLFFTYANSLQKAGLKVQGWTTCGYSNAFGIHEFILLATRPEYTLTATPELTRMPPGHPRAYPRYYQTFPEMAPLHDESPWTMGLTGLFFEPNALRKSLVAIFVLALVGAALLLFFTLRSPSNQMGPARSILVVLAGIAIGLNAVYLENALIFWLIPHMFNPLSAFFVGAAFFLLLWGLSSFGLSGWKWIGALGLAGSMGMVAMACQWQGTAAVFFLVVMILGSGLFFPLMSIRYRQLLLVIFAADALGGLVGGLLGIWIPMLMGFRDYFNFLPWICLATILLAGACAMRQPGQQ